MHETMLEILRRVQAGQLSLEDGARQLEERTYMDLGHTKFDTQREHRNGLPEVVYAAGKTPRQVADIFAAVGEGRNILATRVSRDMADQVLATVPGAEYNESGRTLALVHGELQFGSGQVAIVTAGTSDLAVAEEARVSCEMFGVRARVYADVGVAGIHRLFDKLEGIRVADVVIVAAGMEGALASVVGGLVAQPVIAVPTSVGYGAALNGFTALFAMLNSCAGGVSVVNIDNGFGAACAACRIINRIRSSR